MLRDWLQRGQHQPGQTTPKDEGVIAKLKLDIGRRLTKVVEIRVAILEAHPKVIEPLRMLFKDEVRRVGREMGIDAKLLGRHPFPGPGLGIRILGEVNAENVKLLQDADRIWIDKLREHGHYDRVWQAGAILLPVQSVGVMGDERTYEQAVALRAVSSTDGMTADWVDFPHAFLAEVSNAIINKVRGINRVVYDISSKPPATIEWE